MLYDSVIHGGSLMTPAGARVSDLAICGEKIAAIGEGLSGRRSIDARGCLVLPGAIDPHVHLQMPAGPVRSSDDWETGTIAAAHGGTTTVIDFVEPELDPDAPDGAGSLLAALRARRAEAEKAAVIDFGLHMTLRSAHPKVLAEIPHVVAAGCPSFKTYLTYDGFRLDDRAFLTVLEAVGAAGGLALVHAENDAAIAYLQQKLISQGLLGPASHPLSRPPVTESEAVTRAVALAGIAGCPLYVVHVSTGDAARAVTQARARSQIVFGETCPQYLLLNDGAYLLGGFEAAKYVCCPPLRPASEATELWDALANGGLQTVATDHCPFFFKGEKELGRDDFTAIPSGLPGVETRLALLHTYGVVQGRLSPTAWVDACCSTPAKIFGLYPRKGALAPGSDADLVIFDPAAEVTITHSALHEHVDYTPYEGRSLRGYPKMTLSRGRVLIDEGEFVGEKGGGQFLARARFTR